MRSSPSPFCPRLWLGWPRQTRAGRRGPGCGRRAARRGLLQQCSSWSYGKQKQKRHGQSRAGRVVHRGSRAASRRWTSGRRKTRGAFAPPVRVRFVSSRAFSPAPSLGGYVTPNSRRAAQCSEAFDIEATPPEGGRGREAGRGAHVDGQERLSEHISRPDDAFLWVAAARRCPGRRGLSGPPGRVPATAACPLQPNLAAWAGRNNSQHGGHVTCPGAGTASRCMTLTSFAAMAYFIHC